MAKNGAEQQQGAEIAQGAEMAEDAKKVLDSAAELMRLLAKTVKAHRIYLPNNPVLVRFMAELGQKLEAHLAEYGDFKIDVDAFEIRCEGKTVYESRDAKESLPFRMHSDGIRSIVFGEGMEEREIIDFVEVLGKNPSGDLDSDVVTMLWTRDLPHLTCILAEDCLEFETGTHGEASGGSQQAAIRGIYGSASLETPRELPSFPRQILYLTEEESEQLRLEREIEERTAPLDEALNVLFAILKAEQDAALFDDFAGIAVNLAGRFVENGEIGNALRLTRFLSELSGSESIPAQSRERLGKGVGGIFTYEKVAPLRKAIDGAGEIAPEELAELMRCFGSGAVQPLCELLALAEQRPIRHAIVQALADLGREVPELFFPHLQDERWYVVRNMVCILAGIGSPQALEPLSRLVGHPEPMVRREVLLFMEAMPDPRAKSLLIGFLKDPSKEMRSRAIQRLAAAKTVAAFRPLADMIAAKEFGTRDSGEKLALCKALGEIGADRAVPIFREMLTKKHWFSKAKQRDAAMLAAAGLRKAGTEAALALLREAEAEKNGEAGAILSRAVRMMGEERAKKAAARRGEEG